VADLDPVSQKVAITGGAEMEASLNHIGEVGANMFNKMGAAAESSKSSFVSLSSMVLGLGGGIGAALAAVSAFVVTSANAGASMTSLTDEISDDWRTVQENIATASDTAQHDLDAMSRATVNYQRAQESASASDTHAAQERVQNSDSMAEAGLSLEKAQNRLMAAYGLPVPPALKKLLEIQEAQLGVQKAQEAVGAANLKSAEAEAQADLRHAENLQKVKTAHDAMAEAQKKATEDALKDPTKIADALSNIATAGSKAGDGLNIAKVSTDKLSEALQVMASESGDAPTKLQVLQKMAETFANDSNSVINSAQREALATKAAAGTIFESFGPGLATLLGKGTEEFNAFLGSAEKAGMSLSEKVSPGAEATQEALGKLNVDLKALIGSFSSTEEDGGLFVQMLKAVDESMKTGAIHAFADGLKAIGSGIAYCVEKFTDFTSWVDKAFNLTKGTTFKAVMIGVGIALSGILIAIGGVVAKTAAWAILIGGVILGIGMLVDAYKKLNGETEKSGLTKVGLAVIKSASGLDLSKDVGAPAGSAGSANGSAAPTQKGEEEDTEEEDTEDEDDAKEGAEKLGGAAAKTSDAAAKTSDAATDLKDAAADTKDAAAALRDMALKPITTGIKDVLGHAEGGLIHGPGTSTSDSILARLSKGEFVNSAKSVAHYGADLFHALNNMTFPGFAVGGLVGAPIRMANGGAVSASSILNLTIDGQRFDGLRAPEDVAGRLKTYAISQQTSATGRKPSWVK